MKTICIVVCINDKSRPAEIPATQWVKQGTVYTVIDVIICKSQPGQPTALKLAELKTPEPYFGFDASRFRIVELSPSEVLEAEEKA